MRIAFLYPLVVSLFTSCDWTCDGGDANTGRERERVKKKPGGTLPVCLPGCYSILGIALLAECTAAKARGGPFDHV